MKHLTRSAIVAALAAVLVLAALPAWAEEPAERDGMVRIGGKVISVQGATFTVQTPRRGEIKVQTDASTEFKGPKEDLKEGTPIVAAGKLTGDVLHAEKVGIAPKRLGERAKRARRAMKHGIRGEVTSVQGNKFTLKTPKGELTVHTSEQTRFIGIEQEELSAGDKVGVIPDCAGARSSGDGSARPDDHRGERLAPGKFGRDGEGNAKRAAGRRLKGCIQGSGSGRSVKAKAVLSVPDRPVRKDALTPGEAGFSA